MRLHKILYGLCCMAVLALSSCHEDLSELGGGEQIPDGKVKVYFTTSLPQPQTLQTRSLRPELNAEQQQSLDVILYVFSADGFLLDKAKAQQVSTSTKQVTRPVLDQYGNETGTTTTVTVPDETKFSVVLTKTTNKRIVHFVAYEGASSAQAFTAENFFGNAQSIIGGFKTGTTSGIDDGYWQRVVLDNGITTNEGLFNRVPLVRNFAQVSVKNEASNFTFQGFVVVGAPTSGAVAPYNESKGAFQEYMADYTPHAEAAKTYTQLSTDGYKGYLPQGVQFNSAAPADGDFSLNARCIYETPNADGANKGRVFLIIKGRYNNRTQYYKADLVYNGKHGPEFYNVLRNMKYQMTIKSVSGNGESSIAAAMVAPASNNLSSSTQTMAINNISDGTSQRLEVSDTYICDQDGGTVVFYYKYTDVSGTVNNDLISIFAEDKNIFSESQYWDSTDPDLIGSSSLSNGANDATGNWAGWKKVTLSVKDPSALPLESILKLFVDQGKMTQAQKTAYTAAGAEFLSRNVTVDVRNPYKMKVECPTTKVNNNQAKVAMVINLFIEEPNPQLFPLEFYIEPESKSICPNSAQRTVTHGSQTYDATMATNVGPCQYDASQGQTFQYVRTVTYEEFQAIKANATAANGKLQVINGVTYYAVPCNFITNAAGENSTTVWAKNTYYELAGDAFYNDDPAFASRVATITGTQYLGKGQDITLTFTPARTGTFTITWNEGGETSTSTVTVANNQVNTEMSVTYKTRTFDKSDISAVVSATVNGRQQTVSATSQNTHRHLIHFPKNMFKITMGLGGTFTAQGMSMFVYGTNPDNLFASGSTNVNADGLIYDTYTFDYDLAGNGTLKNSVTTDQLKNWKMRFRPWDPLWDSYWGYKNTQKQDYTIEEITNAIAEGSWNDLPLVILTANQEAIITGTDYLGKGQTIELTFIAMEAGSHSITFHEGTKTKTENVNVTSSQVGTVITVPYTTQTFAETNIYAEIQQPTQSSLTAPSKNQHRHLISFPQGMFKIQKWDGTPIGAECTGVSYYLISGDNTSYACGSTGADANGLQNSYTFDFDRIQSGALASAATPAEIENWTFRFRPWDNYWDAYLCYKNTNKVEYKLSELVDALNNNSWNDLPLIVIER